MDPFQPFPKRQWEKSEWDQIKNWKKKDLIKYLDADANWKRVGTDGSRYIYKTSKRQPPHEYVEVHYHAKDGFRNPGLLKKRLDQICWDATHLRSRKIIK